MEEKEKGHERWMLTTEREGKVCVWKRMQMRGSSGCLGSTFDMQVVVVSFLIF